MLLRWLRPCARRALLEPLHRFGVPPSPLFAHRVTREHSRHRRQLRAHPPVQQAHTLLRDQLLVSRARQESFRPHTTAMMSRIVSSAQLENMRLLQVRLHALNVITASIRR